MSDSKPEEQPVEETPKGSTLSNLVESIAGSPKEEKSSTGTSFPVAIILIGVVVLIVSVLGIMLVLARRKAARLAAQVRKLEEEKLQLKENQLLEENEEKRAKGEAIIKATEEKIAKTEEALEEVNALGRARAESLASVTTWDDLTVVDKREP